MNIYQRIVLILGAIGLILAIWTTPRVQIVKGTILKFNPRIRAARTIDVRTATMRAVAVAGATALVFFALKKKSKN